MTGIHFIYYSEITLSNDLGLKLIKDLQDTLNQIASDLKFDFFVSDFFQNQIGTEEAQDVLVVLLDQKLMSNIECVNQLNKMIDLDEETIVFQIASEEVQYNDFHQKIIKSFPIKMFSESADSTFSEKQYWEKVVDLGYDIFHSLNQDPNQRKVYLAEVDSRYEHLRAELRRELLKQGFSVFPKDSCQNLSLEAIDIEDDLDKCELCVHIVPEWVMSE